MSQNRYQARIAETPSDIQAVQQLRYRAFVRRDRRDACLDGLDADPFDERCTHVMVEVSETGQLVATFRLLRFETGADIQMSYSAQHYELNSFSGFTKPLAELGRFCIDPDATDPSILRVAWGALVRYVDHEGVEMLFGCSSFQGTDAQAYADVFAMLRDEHLAPKRWLPRKKAPNVFRFAQRLRRDPDRKTALRTMPPLLRSYLSLGGWVSDHAVVDRDLNTLHVFTGLEVRDIPPARARVLRATAC